MLNIEKFKKEIENINYCFAVTHENMIVECKISGIPCSECIFNDKSNEINCEQAKMWWLGKEYKEPILTEEEKVIIKNILKAFEPFGKELSYITKDHWNCDESCFLNFKYGNDSFGTLTFNSGKLFKGMEINKKYTLKELGL